MKKTKMLKKNYEFRKVLSKGKYFSGKNIEAFIKENNKNYFNHDYPFISPADACSTTSFGSCQFAERRNRILCAGNFNTVCGKCFACYFVGDGDCGCCKYLFWNLCGMALNEVFVPGQTDFSYAD